MSIPRPEHPRPDFERKTWINLNGEWQFEIDNAKSGLEKGWSSGKDFSRRIIVPFPPESALSGVGEKDFMESVWYRRFFSVPDEWLDGRILLHFGAVDYKATVWVN
ncbi:MAG: beta-galactosidase, partial [Candidatus Bathyarchaeia archaeon]